MIDSNRQFQNFCEYQFKGNYNRCCNFPNYINHLIYSLVNITSLNNNIKIPKRLKRKRKNE
jgi:hypothetical protein